jgi:diguanylate cyclase (GGDEF)-like protein
MSSPPLTSPLPAPKLHILVAESGSSAISDVLQSLFQVGTDSPELTFVSVSSTLIPAIKLIQPHVIFVDLALDTTDPLGLVRNIHRLAPDIPLIVFANSTDIDHTKLCLHEGATDYVLKSHAETKLVDRVLRVALESNTISGLTDLLRDPLTGLYNRHGFAALATRAVRHAQKSDGRMILLSAEITNLTNLGEEFGPSNLEQAVRDLASLLRRNFRSADLLARLSEALFAVLAPDALEPTTAIMRQRLENRLAALNTSRAPWGEIKLSLRAAFWNAAGETSFPELDALLGSELEAVSEIASQPFEPLFGGTTR